MSENDTGAGAYVESAGQSTPSENALFSHKLWVNTGGTAGHRLDLRGADLSQALIDERTRLPSHTAAIQEERAASRGGIQRA